MEFDLNGSFNKETFFQFKDLELKLIESQDARSRMIATDGVFSMDGNVAPLPQICDLAEKLLKFVKDN